MDKILRLVKKFIPKKLFRALQPAYHYSLAFIAACIYRFPSRKIKVVMVTGTKGKTSTAEMINAVLEAGGFKTALAGTLRFKVGDSSRRNLYKMTMPGRFFVQKFLRQAVDAECEWVVLEMTSEAAVQYRHAFVNADALVFLNLSPEHIESHGGYDNYVAAKVSLATALKNSSKPHQNFIGNKLDKETPKFVAALGNVSPGAVHNVCVSLFSLNDASAQQVKESGVSFTYKGVAFSSSLPGLFTIENMLAAITFAETVGISLEHASKGLTGLKEIGGRLQKITLPENNPLHSKQNFTVVVDYAHTADSLKKLYGAFGSSRKICVLGNTGGGRDKWKRPEMGKVADENCAHIILANEDPYDEDPMKIIMDVKEGIKNKPCEIILDRRSAINKAISLAQSGDVVILSGKGTDPYIMEANGKRTPWSDADVTREELAAVLALR